MLNVVSVPERGLGLRPEFKIVISGLDWTTTIYMKGPAIIPLPPPLQIMIGHVTMEPHPTRIRSGHVLKQRKFTFQHFLTNLKGIITVEIYHNFVSN